MARPETTTIPLPIKCPHGKEFKSFRGAAPGTVVYDPGCRHPKQITRMMAHYVGPTGLITKSEWIRLYEKGER